MQNDLVFQGSTWGRGVFLVVSHALHPKGMEPQINVKVVSVLSCQNISFDFNILNSVHIC